MQIHGLCIIKNEADIIAQTLRDAARWCDHLYVFDNGSTDGSWEIVQELASELTQIVPFKQDPQPFSDALRSEILRAYKHHARRGDWWCILDADEFYVDDPREFLAKVPKKYRAVWPQKYVYLFTEKEAAAYREDPQRFQRGLPVQDLLRHYILDPYSELRFFRHDPALDHVPSSDLHPIYPRRIRQRHYGYRSPKQIGVRLHTRREPMERGEFIHEKRSSWVQDGADGPVPVSHPFPEVKPGAATSDDFSASWEERIAWSTDCHFDAGEDSLVPPLAWSPPPPPPRRSVRSVIRRTVRKLQKMAALGVVAPLDYLEPVAALAG